jgi:hypothetical protein
MLALEFPRALVGLFLSVSARWVGVLSVQVVPINYKFN